MKSLKLDHQLAQEVLAGTKTNTWRINDEKNLSVNDEIDLIDKVDPKDPSTWRSIGVAKIDKIHEKRLGEVTANDMVGHKAFKSIDEMYEVYRKYYGPSVGPHTAVKIIFFSFKAHKKPLKPEVQLKVSKVKLYTDGGSRGNPGPSATGFVIMDEDDKVLVEKGAYLGITTNNQAEYQALKSGLEEVKKLGVHEVDVFMDSMLVVNQIKGIFKVKNRDLWPIHQAIKDLIATFKKTNISYVPREFNKLADAEVNKALDAREA